MKRLYVAMAAFATATAAVPAAAQYGADRDYRQDGVERRLEDLRLRIDDGVRRGLFGREEAFSLHEELRMLLRLEDHYRRGGFGGWERGDLQRRLVLLRDRIRYAESYGERSYRPGYEGGWDDREPGASAPGWNGPGAPPPPVDRPLPRADDYQPGDDVDLPDELPDDRNWQDPDRSPDDGRWQDEGLDDRLGREPLVGAEEVPGDEAPDGDAADDEDWDDSDWEYEPI